ncbi:hypothetical protein HYY70_01345 [Candidatus Woesearchaeota archaeon]|nr:hypothetical protein [Candidatus Woesearchaeota archaeon]
MVDGQIKAAPKSIPISTELIAARGLEELLKRIRSVSDIRPSYNATFIGVDFLLEGFNDRLSIGYSRIDINTLSLQGNSYPDEEKLNKFLTSLDIKITTNYPEAEYVGQKNGRNYGPPYQWNLRFARVIEFSILTFGHSR